MIIKQVENRWVNKLGLINFNNYNLTEDTNSEEWLRLFDDVKQAYAKCMNWSEDEYWYEDEDKLFKAEEGAYSVITEIRKKNRI